jgi:hypothetical protein
MAVIQGETPAEKARPGKRLTKAFAETLRAELSKLPEDWSRYEVILKFERQEDGSVGLTAGKYELWHELSAGEGSLFADCDMLID